MAPYSSPRQWKKSGIFTFTNPEFISAVAGLAAWCMWVRSNSMMAKSVFRKFMLPAKLLKTTLNTRSSKLTISRKTISSNQSNHTLYPGTSLWTWTKLLHFRSVNMEANAASRPMKTRSIFNVRRESKPDSRTKMTINLLKTGAAHRCTLLTSPILL